LVLIIIFQMLARSEEMQKAAANGHREVVKTLLSAGVDPKIYVSILNKKTNVARAFVGYNYMNLF